MVYRGKCSTTELPGEGVLMLKVMVLEEYEDLTIDRQPLLCCVKRVHLQEQILRSIYRKCRERVRTRQERGGEREIDSNDLL